MQKNEIKKSVFLYLKSKKRGNPETMSEREGWREDVLGMTLLRAR